MECPFCGAEMEAGSVLSSQTLLWTPYEDSKVSIRFWKRKGEYFLNRTPLGNAKLSGFRCPQCRKLILDYKTAE